MVRLVILCNKNPKLTKGEFKDYYENKHVPLVKRVLGQYTFPDEYTRSYIDTSQELSHEANGKPLNSLTYDAIVHFVFHDPANLEKWMKAYHEHIDEIAADEAIFADRSSVAVYLAEDHTAVL